MDRDRDVNDENSPIVADVVVQFPKPNRRCSSDDNDDDEDERSSTSMVEVTLPMSMFAHSLNNRKMNFVQPDIDVSLYDRICTIGK